MCDFCNGKEILIGQMLELGIVDNMLRVKYGDELEKTNHFIIEYCPICGERLTEEEPKKLF